MYSSRSINMVHSIASTEQRLVQPPSLETLMRASKGYCSNKHTECSGEIHVVRLKDRHVSPTLLSDWDPMCEKHLSELKEEVVRLGIVVIVEEWGDGDEEDKEGRPRES